MSRSLDSIKKPINEALNAFEGHFRKAMESQVPLLDKITFYLVKRKGKQVRPMFVFLSAKVCGEISEATFRAASMILSPFARYVAGSKKQRVSVARNCFPGCKINE